MSKSSKCRLWRVDWVHIRGYRAPSVYVEAETRRLAIKLAKEKSRLGDFEKQWSCYPVAILSEEEKAKLRSILD
jgi:hypothetical protein